jgi:hypothetical protein
MPIATLTRRHLMLITASAAFARPASADVPTIHVFKDRNCGCCSAWIDVLAADGFAVTSEDSLGTLLMRYKADNGIPQDMISCHSGKVAGYMLEGHVPPADIRRLLAERPDAIGLAVPGMPYGSPGMGPENERDAYDVFLIRKGGTTEIFTRYEAA